MAPGDSLTLLVLATVLAGFACRRTPVATARAPVVDARAATPALASEHPTVVQQGFTVAAWTRVRGHGSADLPGAVVHVPTGFDDRRGVHVVLLLHSWGSTAMQWVASGECEPIRHQPHIIGWGTDARHDSARVNALLIAPQFAPRAPRDWAGPFAQRAFLRLLLDEVLREWVSPRLARAVRVDDIASITLVGSSAGGIAADSILSRSDLADRVRNVVLFDGLYVGAERFARWLAAGEDRRFVLVHGGGAIIRAQANAFVRALDPRTRGALADHAAGPLEGLIRSHRAVLWLTHREHIGMALALYAKALRGLEFDRISHDALRAKEPWTAITSTPLADGASIEGALDAQDARLRDGSRGEELLLSTEGSRRCEVEAAAHAARGRPRIDPLLQWIDERTVLGESDDALANGTSRLVVVTDARGFARLRLSTHGPWESLGAFVVRARCGDRAEARSPRAASSRALDAYRSRVVAVR